jgi:hypothetical protein
MSKELKKFKIEWDIEYFLYRIFGEPDWLCNMLGHLPPNKPFKKLSKDEFIHSFNLRDK